MKQFMLKQHFQIESARSLPHLPSTHPCSQVHGHSFKITLIFVGPLDPQKGWLIDYNDIQNWMKPILQQIDHRLLNEVSGLENPTTEMIAYWIFDRAKKEMPSLVQVAVSETSSSECFYPSEPLS